MSENLPDIRVASVEEPFDAMHGAAWAGKRPGWTTCPAPPVPMKSTYQCLSLDMLLCVQTHRRGLSSSYLMGIPLDWSPTFACRPSSPRHSLVLQSQVAHTPGTWA